MLVSIDVAAESFIVLLSFPSDPLISVRCATPGLQTQRLGRAR